MNRYEQQAERQRKASIRSGMSVWTAGLALIVVLLVIVGFESSAPSDYFYKGAITVAILFLLLRQIGRRMKARTPRSARPDPESTLKLS